MKLKNIIFTIASITLLIVIGFILNEFFGNPISKSVAKREVLTYFEDKYNKDFTVYSGSYNFLIPDYNFKLGPIDNNEIVFETSRYELTMFDAYGAYLASKELESKLNEIIGKEYPDLKFKVMAVEQHNIEVAGVEFDFYASDPKTRLEKNYFEANVTLVDTGLNNDETIKLMDDMAGKINTELKGIPKELMMDIYLKDINSNQYRIERIYVNGKPIIKKN